MTTRPEDCMKCEYKVMSWCIPICNLVNLPCQALDCCPKDQDKAWGNAIKKMLQEAKEELGL